MLEGADAVHVPKLGIAMPLVIEVRDQNDRPIEGAEVTFQLPSSGPGGEFPGNQPSYTTKTNYQGQAEAAQFRPNNQLGTFTITVTASLGALKRATAVNQTNANEAGYGDRRRSRKWLWISLAGAAAAGTIAYFATRNGSTPSSSITLTPGTITIGAPR